VAPPVPGASRGLAAPEVTAAAAIAAGLPYQGTLAKDGPLRLCYLAAAAQASGRLDLETERSRFALHFRRGSVEHAGSDAAEGDLGRFLVSRGTVSQEAVADAERVRGDLGGDLVAALSSLGLLNPAESFRVLQEHGIAVLARALGAEKGNCRWTPGGPLPPSSFPLGSRWGVLCGAARGLDGLAVRKLLGDRIQRVASRTGGRVQLPELKLTAHEARAAALFDGMSSPAQLAAARPLDAETLLRMALFLGELELLAFGNLSAAAPAPTPTPSAAPAEPSQPRVPANAPTPRTIPASARAASGPPTASTRPGNSPTAPPPGPPGPKPRAEQEPRRPAVPDAASLKDFYEKVRASDHFTTLGVKREATTQQIKAAYFQLAKSYHPDAGLPGEPDEVKKLRVDVFARLGAAWGVLGEEAKRAEYLRELESGGGAELDVSAIFKAEELFQKATVLVRTRQYDKALETLTEASKLNAEEPEFDVWRAWVDFLVAQDRKRQHQKSSAVIEVALKKVPRCLPGYLFLGQMAKISGDIALAERHFKRGLALDPEHAELAREMKYLKK
jgi:tetratricopeptide (TPR) repeat protein